MSVSAINLDVAIIGGGPAGLRAAEILSTDGRQVGLFDQKASVGRKFLVAGRGGLNLTHSESLPAFIERYGEEPERWKSLLHDFSPDDLRAWVGGFGLETYIGTSGRVFPRGQQAAPLLRRWVQRLRHQGVRFHLNHRWTGLTAKPEPQLDFDHAGTPVRVHAHAVILALGGASWPKTGSDGFWTELLKTAGIRVLPLQPANCGYECDWPPLVRAVEGLPLKNITVTADNITVAGELLITRYGLEGGALYQLGRMLRAMPRPAIQLDLKPSFSTEALIARLPVHHGINPAQARKAWRLGDAAAALLASSNPPTEANALARRVKALTLPLRGPRPIAEAISSAGGIAWKELTADLMLRKMPGVFAAGEMIAWEAPTGGYLLQGCLATGTRAAAGVLRYL